VSYLKQTSILSIIQSKFKKFLDRHLYLLLLLLLLLIPLLFIAYHSINGLAVAPAYNNQSVLNLDFERQKISISPMVINLFHSINDNNESSTLKKSTSVFGNNSLRVDIKPSNTTKQKTISTDFIPVNENADYDFSLYLSAKDVNQLHSKILYFDSNKTKIKSALLSGGRSGTFEEPYKIIKSSPNGTKYIKLQILASANPNMFSSYIIDNVKIENLPFKNNDKKILSTSMETNKPIFGNNSLRVDVKPANATKQKTISTDFIPVNKNADYNTSLYISAKDVNQLHSKINYYNSNKTKIKSTFISDARNGTFEEHYSKVDSSPNGTKYIKLQILVSANPNMSSSYIIDNVKIENLPLRQVGFSNNDNEIIIYPKCCKQPGM
jgi:intein-encoded DNA endonuclease-like protein